MAKKSSKTTRDSKQEDTSIVEGWIPKENVATFSEYKYKSPHKTYLEGVVLEIFWEWLSQFIPRFIAPNLITTIGLLVIFVGMILNIFQIE